MNEVDYHYLTLEIYKGFDIIRFKKAGAYTKYLFIGKDGERISNMTLISRKACRNVIDTHVRAIGNQYPEN